MEIVDYNGLGRWSLQGIQDRYQWYARDFSISSPRDLQPIIREEGNRRWIYPVMHQVIEGIDAGDVACVQIGVEFIEENEKFPFGKGLKSSTARALRRSSPNSGQVGRIRKRVVQMLIKEQIPHEYRDYARLLKKVGIGDWWPVIEKKVNRNNPHVMRFYHYFKSFVQLQ